MKGVVGGTALRFTSSSYRGQLVNSALFMKKNSSLSRSASFLFSRTRSLLVAQPAPSDKLLSWSLFCVSCLSQSIIADSPRKEAETFRLRLSASRGPPPPRPALCAPQRKTKQKQKQNKQTQPQAITARQHKFQEVIHGQQPLPPPLTFRSPQRPPEARKG